MGASPSLPLGEASSHVEAHLLGTRALSPSLRGTALLPIRKLLRSGAVSANTEKTVRSERRRQREADGEGPGASCELLSSLLLLDPALERARYRCVPSVANESVWWTTYLRCLNEETLLHLPSLCREQEAADALSRASRALPAGAGAMVSLEVRPFLPLPRILLTPLSHFGAAVECTAPPRRRSPGRSLASQPRSHVPINLPARPPPVPLEVCLSPRFSGGCCHT